MKNRPDILASLMLLASSFFLQPSAFAQAPIRAPQVIANEVDVQSAPLAPVSQLSASVVGATGNATYYYWVVANYTTGQAPASSYAQVVNAPNVLSGSNYVAVSWTPISGAATYDLLRTTSPQLPNTPASIAVATALAGTTFNDQGGGLTSYTLNPAGQKQLTLLPLCITFSNGTQQCTAGTATTPGGSSGSIQYNNAGVFGGAANATYSAATGATTLQLIDKAGQVYNVKAYGAVGNGVFLYNCSITTGTAALTCSGGAFASGDVGKLIEVDGAGSSSGRLLTTIAAVTDATHLTVAVNASTTTSTANVVYGTDDGPVIQSLITTLSTSNGGTMFFPKGIYVINNASDANGFILDIPFNASPLAPWITYKFEGPTNMGQLSTTTGVNTSGAVLYDMSAAVTGFIGASSISPSFPKSDVYVVVDKMGIVIPPTQNYAAIHLQLAYNGDVLNSAVSPNYGPKATNNIPLFGNTSNYGVFLSDQANAGTSSVQNSAIAGFYTGVRGADHAMILRSIFQTNKYAIKNNARFYGMLVLEDTIQGSNTLGIVNDFGDILWGNASFENNASNLGIDTGTEMGTGLFMLADGGGTPKVDTAHMNPGMFWIDGNNGNFNAQGLRTNTASNTDLAGQITLAAGTGSYTFIDTYTSAPICTATDTTAANAVKASTTTTILTLTGTGTDVISYTCVGRN